ncbi:MAG: DUF4440 domain-containing protein [Gemmatimonadota bacterium]|nr:MAG: DUF4440 domain-containing protein [Gemmatimonadota bacterium]
MGTRSVLMLAALALAVVSTACQPPAQEVAELTDEDVAALKDLAETQAVLLMAKDWAGYAANFTEDAVWMQPNEPLRQGRAAIEEWATAAWGPLTMIDVRHIVLAVDGRADLAYVRGSYSATVELPGGPQPLTDVGKFLVITRKQPDGRWLGSILIANADEPPPQEGSET